MPTSFNPAEESQAVSVENRGADDGLHQVIGQSHSAYGCKPTGELAQVNGFTNQHDHSNIPQGDQNAAPVVELIANEHGIIEGPVCLVVACHTVNDQWESRQEADGC